MKAVLVLLLVPFTTVPTWAAADPNQACADKLAQIQNQGVHRGAFLQALKNIDTRNGQIPRYVFMAKLGREKSGEMLIVDTQTGHVKAFPIEHGVPENAGNALSVRSAQRMHFGGALIKFDAAKFNETLEIASEPVSPSLKNKLAASGGYPELSQSMSTCQRFGKSQQALQMDKANNYCFSSEDLNQVKAMLEANVRAGGAPPVLFTYPTRNLSQYLAQVKLPNDAPNACKILEKMPQPSVSQPAAGGGSSAPTDAVQ